jgi:hypothetical protein
MAIYGDEKHNVEMERIDSKTTFTVKLEFTELEAKNPIEAVKKVLSLIQNENAIESSVFEVTNEETLEEFVFDLSEYEENLIVPKK